MARESRRISIQISAASARKDVSRRRFNIVQTALQIVAKKFDTVSSIYILKEEYVWLSQKLWLGGAVRAPASAASSRDKSEARVPAAHPVFNSVNAGEKYHGNARSCCQQIRETPNRLRRERGRSS